MMRLFRQTSRVKTELPLYCTSYEVEMVYIQDEYICETIPMDKQVTKEKCSISRVEEKRIGNIYTFM